MVLRVKLEYLMKSDRRILFYSADIYGTLGKAWVTYGMTLLPA